MGDTNISKQIGRLDLLHSIKKGLQLTGAAPEAIEKYMKVVYICNPNLDPVNAQVEPAHVKLHKVKVSNAAAGTQTLTFTVPTGYKALVKKLVVINSNGSTVQKIHTVHIDGNKVWDPLTNNPAAWFEQAASHEIVLIGDNAGVSEWEFTTQDCRLVNQCWATRTIDIVVVNGGDNFDILEVWYEKFQLKIDESAASDY